jgi:endogenous inhibitor of DNA gyrase (YacG/DUF329 family)
MSEKQPDPPPDKPLPEKPPRPCPICGKMSVQKFHPFCSKRCADVDLNRWLGGVYAIPGEPAPDDDGSQER